MNAMMGMASLLNETPLTPEQRGFSTSILHAGDELLELINNILIQDILQFSKIDSGKELELKDFDLPTSIEEVLEVFGKKASESGVDLVYSIKDNVPAHLVGDAYRIRQILMNLVENAFRFTTSGEIFIGVSAMPSIEDSRLNIEFEVRDSGTGMFPAKLQKVIHDLQVPDTMEATHETIGLTLVICKKLIAIMGGTLRVESTPDEGTTFRFNILANASIQPNRAHIYAEMAIAEGKKVLLVDDNATALHAIRLQMTKWKVVPVTASSAGAAMEILNNQTDIDLIITDLKMPGTDGIQLSKLIKEKAPNMPIILLNNSGDEGYKLYPDLFIACINKPVKQHLLSKYIASGLRQKISSSLSNKQKQKQKFSPDFARKSPLRILVGEDDLMNQQMVKMTLNKLGYDINICNNGKEVLEEVSVEKYDLILMDVQMPEMDGLEATRMIRLCLTEQPVIIAMTANTLQGDREMCLAAGMDDYISKPVKIEELVDLLEKWSLQVQQYYNK
jgi:CheY-like chemotaxis protein